MAKHVIIVVVLWTALSAISLAIILTFTPFPIAASEEADFVDDAFTLLTILAVPVFTFVISVLTYSMFQFRVKGEPNEDGPAVVNKGPIIAAWLVGSIGLTLFVIVNPGIVGLNEIRHAENETPDVTIQLEARQFAWRANYLEAGVTSRKELVLPIDERSRFLIQSKDVLHSFWIPAFRIKIDAVPGQTTRTAARPNLLGGFDDDPNYRVQCAELCGVGHAKMQMPVRVVSRAEFDAWIAEQNPIAARR